MKTLKANSSHTKENRKLFFLLPIVIGSLLLIKVGTDIYAHTTRDPLVKLMGNLNLSEQQLKAIQQVQGKYQPKIKQEEKELISSIKIFRESVDKNSLLALQKEKLDINKVKAQALFEIRDKLNSNQKEILDKYLIEREEKLAQNQNQ